MNETDSDGFCGPNLFFNAEDAETAEDRRVSSEFLRSSAVFAVFAFS
ncbi:hypothetical protein QUF72_13320 [Desulfobacterales bacterium HSG2]|nr:hypothetical protein [Desulfobacterales bacterium HSG2]